MKKIALLSMDVEEWYDAAYMQNNVNIDKKYLMSDGIENFCSIIKEHSINATFFLLLHMADEHTLQINRIIDDGNEIALHGFDHLCPLEKNLDIFEKEVLIGKEKIENTFNIRINGYRAPSYSLDAERLEIIQKLHFSYDSSKIDSTMNKYYGQIDLKDFNEITKGVYKKEDFYEFEIPSEKFFFKKVNIGGGGFFRIFPWFISKGLIKKYIKKHNFFVFFIHPFEMSNRQYPKVKGIGAKKFLRSHLGLGTVQKKVKKLIGLLEKEGFSFMTYSNAIDYLRNGDENV